MFHSVSLIFVIEELTLEPLSLATFLLCLSLEHVLHIPPSLASAPFIERSENYYLQASVADSFIRIEANKNVFPLTFPSELLALLHKFFL